MEFSIALPIHNGEQLVATAIRSVVGQTHDRWRLFVLENASDDRTLEIIRSFEDPRIVIVPSSGHLSIEANWARIRFLPLTELVTILSHDDVLYPEFLAEVVRLIHAEPEASLYQTSFDLIDANGRIVRACRPIPFKETGDDFLRARHVGARDSYGTGYVMRSKDLLSVGGLPESFPRLLYADDVTWFRLASLSYKVCSPRRLFAYRIHKSSASHTMDLESQYLASSQYLRFLRTVPFGQSERQLAIAGRYVGRQFRGWHHKLLVDLIDPREERALQDYADLRDRLERLSRQDGLFQAVDAPCRIYEAVARVRSRTIRRLLLRGILGLRRARMARRSLSAAKWSPTE